jgi:hypothetical protein
MKIVFGIFFILHGLVHLLYAGQSARLFELRPGLIWPDGSWLFSKLAGDSATRIMAGILLVLAALALIAGGLGFDPKQRLVATGCGCCCSVLGGTFYAFMEWQI